MAVVRRMERSKNYHGFASRLPEEEYNALTVWAWENKLTFANACATLIRKALKAEKGNPYTPEAGETSDNLQ